jgi:hypothetical protein
LHRSPQVRARFDEFAYVLCIEGGKPMTAARAEVSVVHYWSDLFYLLLKSKFFLDEPIDRYVYDRRRGECSHSRRMGDA